MENDKKKVNQKKCPHTKTEIREHSRKNYPFGIKKKKNTLSRNQHPIKNRTPKHRFYAGKRFTEHCKKCNKIIREWKK